jgi:hypothetical protein
MTKMHGVNSVKLNIKLQNTENLKLISKFLFWLLLLYACQQKMMQDVCVYVCVCVCVIGISFSCIPSLMQFFIVCV